MSGELVLLACMAALRAPQHTDVTFKYMSVWRPYVVKGCRMWFSQQAVCCMPSSAALVFAWVSMCPEDWHRSNASLRA